jgi:hypothetical protein
MKKINLFVIIVVYVAVMSCSNSTESEQADQVQAFVDSVQVGTDSGSVDISRGGQAVIGFSLHKTFAGIPEIQLTSLTEMSDMTFYISQITSDSFHVTVLLSGNSSLPSVSKTIKFNWIAFLSNELNDSIFSGSDNIHYNIARGDSQITMLPTHHTFGLHPVLFSTGRTAISDLQFNLYNIDSTNFTSALLLSKNSRSPSVQGIYTLQWLALPTGIYKPGIATGSDSVDFSLSRGQCIQKTIGLSNQCSGQPVILYSSQNAIRDLYINLSEISNTSFKINLCLSNSSSSPNVSGVYNFSWAAFGK